MKQYGDHQNKQINKYTWLIFHNGYSALYIKTDDGFQIKQFIEIIILIIMMHHFHINYIYICE